MPSPVYLKVLELSRQHSSIVVMGSLLGMIMHSIERLYNCRADGDLQASFQVKAIFNEIAKRMLGLEAGEEMFTEWLLSQYLSPNFSLCISEPEFSGQGMEHAD